MTTGDTDRKYILDIVGELPVILLEIDPSESSLKNKYSTGQYFDSEIQEYYLRARQYNPHIARFTSRDPVWGKPYEPVTLHAYLYSRNNPINRVDLSGRMSTVTKVAVSVGVGAVIYAVVTHYEKLREYYEIHRFGVMSGLASTADLKRFRDRLQAAIPKIDRVREDLNLTFENMEQKLREQGLASAGQLGRGFLLEPGTHNFTKGEQYLMRLYENRGTNLKSPDLIPGIRMHQDAAQDLQTEIWRNEAIIAELDKEIERRGEFE
ncbi:MAG: RHS repeat-associated core domain-containing protein [Phycisphaerales bacterium]|nr:MAG: RHS repeat-associated core domain-containing protein [Phycisphaerales bacterium]